MKTTVADLMLWDWRELVVRRMTRAFFVFALLAYLADLPVAIERGAVAHFVTSGLAVLVTAFAAFTKRFSHQERVASLMGVTYVLGVFWLIASGLPGTGRIYLFAPVCLSAVFMSRRTTWVMVGVSLVTYLVVVIAFAAGWLAVPQEVLGRLDEPATLMVSWSVQGVMIVGLSIPVMYAIERLKDNLARLRDSRRDLIFDNEKLEEIIAERTRELKESESLLRETQRLARVGGWSWSPPSNRFELSEEARDLLGFGELSREAVSIELLRQHMPPKERQRARDLFAEVAQDGKPREFDVPVLSRQGTPRWVRVVAHRGEKNGEQAFFGAMRDVTLEKLQSKALVEANAQLKDEAYHDVLTGLGNRRHFDSAVEVLVSGARRADRPISLLFFDIDHFKAYNDNYGHDAGDAVLSGLGHLLAGLIRSDDYVWRYGGEEFVLALDGAPTGAARRRAEELRKQIRSLQIVHDGDVLPPVSVSIGLASAPPMEYDASALTIAADRAMLVAKREGRDRAVVADPDAAH